ncbi:DUF6415 family natural product biosynthesis protein [Streptomyces sp. NPDC008086]|uniref:DUF6415 family natural product biosynthesis protein n=1 Tax=Streptomyces sp. NPDC008086 TaxID=3364807 RepID=UPI0036F078BF
MGSSERAPVDAAMIRQAYTAGLEVWACCPQEPEQREQLRDRLIGHVQLLVPELTRSAARMRGEYRRCAVHVIVRAHHLIEEGAGDSPAAQACHIQDLSVIARALLALYKNPGPLGPPTRRDEIEEAVLRKVCGACSQPIADGEGYERALFASDASGGMRGYLHTDSCDDLADERRRQLRAVP